MPHLQPLVAIRCIAYNQEAYIRDTLEGFVSQQTTFPFVAIVHDDASTDNTAAIIRKYAEKFPNIIRPIIETENQHSKPGNSLGRIMMDAIKSTGAKYVAYCEGDDYWIDSLKLQKQFDFLEAHNDYSFCFHAAYYKNPSDKFTIYQPFKKDCDVSFSQIVMGGGMFCPTPSLFIRAQTFIKIPKVFTSQHIGDYPLQIYLASEGKVRYMASPMCVYRVESDNSWSQRMKSAQTDMIISKELKLLHEIDEFYSLKYHKLFLKRELLYSYLMYYGARKYNQAYTIAKRMLVKGMRVPLKQMLKLLLYKIGIRTDRQ